MTVAELRQKLAKYDPGMAVVLDASEDSYTTLLKVRAAHASPTRMIGGLRHAGWDAEKVVRISRGDR